MQTKKQLLTETTHIYVDDATGDEYIFNGKQLIKTRDGVKPEIGDRPPEDKDEMDDDDYFRKEDEERERQVAKEREENGEHPETEEERKTRLAKLKQLLDDAEFGNKVIASSEKKVQADRRRHEAAKKKEIQQNLKGAEKNTYVMNELAQDLRRFISKEVGKIVKNPSWRVYNGNYAWSEIIMPGYKKEKIGKIPLVQIYIDQSPSWGESDVKLAMDILKSIQEFEKKNLIKIQVYYFSDKIHSTARAARGDGDTGAGDDIMEQLNSMKPDNVIIMTDSDFDWAGLTGTYVAPGGVWMAFRGSRSQKLMNQLHGRRLTKYYEIDKIAIQ